jgi:beta-lactam-binding protein with PASTA domain
MLKARHCSLGRVSHAFSKAKQKGRVLSQRPKPGGRLALNARVNVVVGRGPRRKPGQTNG